jgi:hypothetical protein
LASGTMAGRQESVSTNVLRTTMASTMLKETVEYRTGRLIDQHRQHFLERSKPFLLFACACRKHGRRLLRATRQRAAPEARLARELDLLHFQHWRSEGPRKYPTSRRAFLRTKRILTTYLVTNTGVRHLCDMRDSYRAYTTLF